MKTKHTPDPWPAFSVIFREALHGHGYGHTNPAATYYLEFSGETLVRLRAAFTAVEDFPLRDAAPELLEACKRALIRLETIEREKGVHSHETIPELQAAIAKATGEA